VVVATLLLLCAVAIVATVVKRRIANTPSIQEQLRAPEFLLAILVLVYGACLTYAGWKTVISFDSRLLYPMLPEVALLIGAGVALIERFAAADRARRVMVRALAGMLVISYLGLHMQSLRVEQTSSLKANVTRDLEERLPVGTKAHAFIKSLLGPSDVIMSNLGQATGYVLQQPTISFVSPEYSKIIWDESSIQAVAAQFGAKLLILHHAPDQPLENQVPSDFLRRLAAGAASPLLIPLAHTASVTVYKLNLPPDPTFRVSHDDSSASEANTNYR
jgi:hypothetical protein